MTHGQTPAEVHKRLCGACEDDAPNQAQKAAGRERETGLAYINLNNVHHHANKFNQAHDKSDMIADLTNIAIHHEEWDLINQVELVKVTEDFHVGRGSVASSDSMRSIGLMSNRMVLQERLEEVVEFGLRGILEVQLLHHSTRGHEVFPKHNVIQLSILITINAVARV